MFAQANLFVFAFVCSKRAYQTQFKRWGFPSKQNPAHKNTLLVSRVKELWEHNTNQRDMLRILNDEGFEIKERELMRVRAKNRWLLRVPNGMKQAQTQTTQGASADAEAEAGAVEAEADVDAEQRAEDEGLLALQQEVYKNDSDFDVVNVVGGGNAHAGAVAGASGNAGGHNHNLLLAMEEIGDPSAIGISPEIAAKRKERLEALKSESAERWASRKRRRRTRGWAGLPADPPGPPRFPSETTIDESKQYLNLDNELYRATRDQFQRICEEAGFVKKTTAGPERWQAAKDRLINESVHLQTVFHNTEPNQRDAKALALDIVCTDVTKRMRTMERRMTIAEAKNTLGINPEESRQIRNAFYDTLRADHFTSKLEAGDEHWAQLKMQWIRNSQLLQRILQGGHADPGHAGKLKALEVLCRDVMKRLRDDQVKRDPARKRSSRQPRLPSTGTGNANNNANANTAATNTNMISNEISNGISTLASQALASAPITHEIDLQIDPSLLQAANVPVPVPSFSSPGTHQHQSNPHSAFEYMNPDPDQDQDPDAIMNSGGFNAYTTIDLEISPQSHIQDPPPKHWTERLTMRSMDELRGIISSRFPYSIVSRIEGVERDYSGEGVDANGNAGVNQRVWLLEEDHELEAYLTNLQDRRACFMITLGQI